jgi:hypothetical protein
VEDIERLSTSSLTELGLNHLSAINPKVLPRSLTKLNLSSCNSLDDDILESLVKTCPDLTVLILDYDKITDAGLKHLKELKNLQKISLVLVEKITDEGVLSLEETVPTLKKWKLKYCTGVSTDVRCRLDPKYGDKELAKSTGLLETPKLSLDLGGLGFGTGFGTGLGFGSSFGFSSGFN